jgi:CubicO group peptidase (beta-lactamase class C family)
MIVTKRFLSQAIVGLLVLTLLFTPLTPAPAIASPAAPQTIPSDYFDPFSTGWASARNLDPVEFSTHYADMYKEGYMVTDIEVVEMDGIERISAAWQKNPDNRGWNEVRNLSHEEFSDTWNRMRDMGYRLIDQESYVLDGSRMYAGVWVENIEKLDWLSYRNVDSDEFSLRHTRYRGQGFMMIDVEAYQVGSALLYSAVWVENTEDLDWIIWRDLTSAQFTEKFQEYREKYRMIDVESYFFNGVQYYAGIWVENKTGRHWVVWRDMTAKQYNDRWLSLRDAGFRLINFEVYQTADGWRYAGIWRQNGIRPIWEFKDSVDQTVETYQSDNSVPGMSVAVYNQNRLVYLRGFGHADVDDDIIAHSRTIYRTASVAKAVAGVLGILLDEAELLDLESSSSTYIENLPSQHTHTVAQTITNRSGVGHYAAHDSVSGQYDTAAEALAEIWNTALVSSPGSAYIYSTHAYTYLGAAMEAATDRSIQAVLVDYLSQPYNLGSLRAENRSIPHPYRATLYNQQNQEVQADNLSWKTLGGGLEVSAYDLVRLAAHLLNENILDEDALDLMWTRPDNLWNYGYGWDVGTTHLGRTFIGKAGAQNGARSYICIYPTEDLAIAILSNRRGHDTRTLCRDIAAIILNGQAASQQVLAGLGLQAALNFDEVEEPHSEALNLADVFWPQENPVAVPTPEDLMESGEEVYLMHLPLISR